MGVRYFPWFDIADAGVGTLTFSRSALPNFTVNLSTLTSTAWNGSSSSILSHLGLLRVYSYGASGAQRFNHFGSSTFGTILEYAIQAAATIAGWPSPTGLTVAFNFSTCRYTLAYATGTFAVAFNSDAQSLALLGYTANLSGASSYVATCTPTYVTDCTLLEVSVDSEAPYYEPDSIGNHVVNDEGSGTGVSRGGDSPLYANFRQQYETKAKTLRPYAAVTDPFTLQHLFEHCRGEWPFFVYVDSGTSRIDCYTFRTEGIAFHAQPASPGNYSQFHIPFECMLEGYGSL